METEGNNLMAENVILTILVAIVMVVVIIVIEYRDE